MDMSDWRKARSGNVVYGVKTGSPVPESEAQKVGEFIAALDEITPRGLVDKARPEDSLLHKYYEWDDAKAGAKWRDQTSRTIVNHFVIIAADPRTEEKHTVPAFVSVMVSDEKQATDETAKAQRVYMPTVKVFEDKDLKAQTIANALRELKAWRERYRKLAEFEPIFAAIDEIAV